MPRAQMALSDLPDDVLRVILCHLNLGQVVALGGTCRRLHDLLEEDCQEVWRGLARRVLPTLPRTLPGPKAREFLVAYLVLVPCKRCLILLTGSVSEGKCLRCREVPSEVRITKTEAVQRFALGKEEHLDMMDEESAGNTHNRRLPSRLFRVIDCLRVVQAVKAGGVLKRARDYGGLDARKARVAAKKMAVEHQRRDAITKRQGALLDALRQAAAASDLPELASLNIPLEYLTLATRRVSFEDEDERGRTVWSTREHSLLSLEADNFLSGGGGNSVGLAGLTVLAGQQALQYAVNGELFKLRRWVELAARETAINQRLVEVGRPRVHYMITRRGVAEPREFTNEQWQDQETINLLTSPTITLSDALLKITSKRSEDHAMQVRYNELADVFWERHHIEVRSDSKLCEAYVQGGVFLKSGTSSVADIADVLLQRARQYGTS